MKYLRANTLKKYICSSRASFRGILDRKKLVLSPFLNYTALFLVSTWPFRNGSVFACGTTCSIAAIGVKSE